MRLKDVLKGKLNKRELALVPSSFDLVGDIAIFNEIPEELKRKESWQVFGETQDSEAEDPGRGEKEGNLA